MLLVVGWSAVMVWLNVRPSVRCLTIAGSEEPIWHMCIHYHGWPCMYGNTERIHKRSEPCLRPRPFPPTILRYRFLFNLFAVVICVAYLTFVSKYLLRAMVIGVKAFLGKPPWDKEEGPSKSN